MYTYGTALYTNFNETKEQDFRPPKKASHKTEGVTQLDSPKNNTKKYACFKYFEYSNAFHHTFESLSPGCLLVPPPLPQPTLPRPCLLFF